MVNYAVLFRCQLHQLSVGYINRDHFQYPESLLKMSVNGTVICKCIPLPRSMPGPNTVCSDNVLCTNTEYKLHLCILNSI